MCGINGVVGGDQSMVRRMNDAIAHRGPDGMGEYITGKVALGHRRLSIIDLSERGKQPMTSSSGNLTIVYNGELYNYRELRRELSSYHYQSETDTEVVLAAYEKWGAACLERFNGIFAFAIWDHQKEELFLARDQMGVKPLYYAQNGDTLVFSSEMKALLAYGIAPKLNYDMFSRYLLTTDIIGSDSFIQGISTLPAAHYAVFSQAALTLQQYWQPNLFTENDVSRSDLIATIKQTLHASVERQLISDRPVGLFLSGGIDSNAVLAEVTKLAGSAQTYTSRFESKNPAHNFDADVAKRTAAHYGAAHTEVVIKPTDVIALLEDVVWHMDNPAGTATALSQLALARTASANVRVILTGEGGDEMFGGYLRYRMNQLIDTYQVLPGVLRSRLSSLHPTLHKLNTSKGFDRFALFYCAQESLIKKMVTSEFPKNAMRQEYERSLAIDGSIQSANALMEVDRRLLAAGSLLRSDKLLMAAGVEGRVPLLDLELVKLAKRIPAHYKVSLFDTKVIFKEAMKDNLPGYLFNEKKRGWVTPTGVWLREPAIQQYAQEVLRASYYEGTATLFNWDQVERILQDHQGGKSSYRAQIWALLAFQVWARRFGVTI